MDRLDILRRGISKSALGIEIGPYFAPLVPKAAGYNALSLDVFDAVELRRRARADPNILRLAIARIEAVDMVGSAPDIASLAAARGVAGRVDYIVSSHNFEHLPDPVRFLQGCAEVLRPGGQVTMAIPDRRCTFDYFRPHSQTGDMIAAHFERRERPAPEQVFSALSLEAHWQADGEDLISFSLAHDPARLTPRDHLKAAFDAWQNRQAAPDDTYHDTHCWVFTPASFELVFGDLRFLGLVALDLETVDGPLGGEFFVRLTKPLSPPPDDFGYPARRAALLHRINAEAGVNALAEDAGDDPVALRSQLAASRARLAALDAALTSMRRSTSWRLTAPLRLAARALKRWR